MFAVMVPAGDSNDNDGDGDDNDDSTSTKRPDLSVRVSKAKKKTFATRKANTLQRKQSRFRFKFDNAGTMRFFRDNGMREDRNNTGVAPPLSQKSTEGEYQKLYRAAKEEDKAWEDFLRMMGADIGASRSDLRGIFEESRKAAGLSFSAQEDLRKFLDTHPGMGDATTQAWVSFVFCFCVFFFSRFYPNNTPIIINDNNNTHTGTKIQQEWTTSSHTRFDWNTGCTC
jgi:hypothetical protein